MPCYPEIASPCPVADRLQETLDGDFCRRCSKQVADLDSLSGSARYRLLADTGGELCVRYRLPAIVAAAALLAASPAAAAQDASPPAAGAVAWEFTGDEIVVGGARKLTRAERAELRREARLEERREAAERRRAAKAARPAP